MRKATPLKYVLHSLLVFGALALACRAADAMPNFVILYSDDAGYADFGFQPNCVEEMKHLTPHIDTIARDGARFTDAYMTGCVCSPSRAGLMTGRYQQRFGFDNNLPPGHKNGVALAETFGVKRLQAMGYTTGLVGKWHLGYPAEFHPNKRGFDWFYGLLQGSRSYYPYENPSPHRVILENDRPTPEEGYLTDRLGDAACRFIGRHKDEPFYLFVSFTAPHGPNQPREGDADRIAHIEPRGRRNHVGLLVALDDNVGKILKAIEDNGIEEETLVLFTNDNGGQTATGAKNTPLRGKKGTLWEGGVRVPWAMRWPGKIAPGSVVTDPVIALDILPTFMEASGHPVDEDWNLDGRSFLPLLAGRQDALPARTLYWRHHGPDGDIALREGTWKLVHNREEPDARPELYDLSTDIGESVELSAKHPDVVKKLSAKMAAWEAELQEPLWGPGSSGKPLTRKPSREKAQAEGRKKRSEKTD